MNKVLVAVAAGRNIFVLLFFAVIGYTLCITPPLDTFSLDAYFGKALVGFGWNFMAAWLITWFFRLIVARSKYKPEGYKFAFAYLVAGLAAVAGVLL